MMSEKLERAMFQSAAETLENMAFMEVLPAPEAESRAGQDGERLAVELLILDPFQGELRLEMPKNLLLKIADTVYGLPAEQLTDQLLEDILSELLNTIAGRFLTAYLEEGQTFRLGLPEVQDSGRSNDEPPRMSWPLDMAGEIFTIGLWCDSL